MLRYDHLSFFEGIFDGAAILKFKALLKICLLYFVVVALFSMQHTSNMSKAMYSLIF